MRDELHAVADGEHRADIKKGEIGSGRPIIIDGAGSAAENDAGRVPFANPLDTACRWVNLRVHSRLANSPRDQLSELGAIIDDEDSGRQFMVARYLRHSM